MQQQVIVAGLSHEEIINTPENNLTLDQQQQLFKGNENTLQDNQFVALNNTYVNNQMTYAAAVGMARITCTDLPPITNNNYCSPIFDPQPQLLQHQQMQQLQHMQHKSIY